MDAVATERLWLTEPRRSTCLARVVAVRGGSFAVDRGLFAPTSRSHRHPQPHDQGTVWWEGEKRNLVRVAERDGILWHTLRGTVPHVGVELNCHLDPDRRLLVSRAHTAMHLLLKAFLEAGAPPLSADPEVKGGGNVRFEFAAPVAPPLLAAALLRANAWVQENRNVRREFVARGLEERTLDRQSFQPPDPYPGPADTLAVVRIEGVCAYPCDGTHVDRTSQVGRIVITQAQSRAGGATVVARVGAKG